jgi:hypothetical protein
MQGGSHRHLDRLQIKFARPTAVLKDDPEQPAYFVFDFLPDCFRRFFSCGVSVSSTGRARQIFALVSIKIWLSSR